MQIRQHDRGPVAVDMTQRKEPPMKHVFTSAAGMLEVDRDQLPAASKILPAACGRRVASPSTSRTEVSREQFSG